MVKKKLSDGVTKTQILQKLWKEIVTGENNIIYDNGMKALL